jgi:hypothetical protein
MGGAVAGRHGADHGDHAPKARTRPVEVGGQRDEPRRGEAVDAAPNVGGEAADVVDDQDTGPRSVAAGHSKVAPQRVGTIGDGDVGHGHTSSSG